MEYFIKKFTKEEEYNNELYALEKLNNSGLTPKLYEVNPSKLEIKMEKILMPQFDPFKIIEKGDDEVLAYAIAEYNAKKIMDRFGVAFYDWKADNLFYDINIHKLIIIDFAGDESKMIPYFNKKYIEDEYSFIKDPNYVSNPSFQKFKELITVY